MVWKPHKHFLQVVVVTGCVRTIVVWKLVIRDEPNCRGELRENHSGMETYFLSLVFKFFFELRENHSGMETVLDF